MSLVSRDLIAVSGPGFQTTFFEKCRGKTAKEIYRCGKGILITRTFVGPVGFAFTQMGKEVGTGVIYTAVGSAAETAIGYLSGVGFVRYIYKVSSIPKIKKTARICYNVAALPYTLYCRGIGELSNKIGISTLEEKWFGEPVYIFNDNRVWIEKNFTLGDQF